MNNQENLIILMTNPEKDKYLYGFALDSGCTIVPPIYEDINFPVGNIFMFKQNDKWGLMSLDGDWLLNPRYDNIFSWNDKYIVIAKYVSCRYICGVIDWSGKEIIPIEYGAIELTDHRVFRCYLDAEYKWGSNHHMDTLKYDGYSYIWKTSRNVIVSDNLKILKRNQKVVSFNDWLLLDGNVLLSPELEPQKWIEYKGLTYLEFTPLGTLMTKDKRGKFGLRDLFGKSILLQIYDDMKIVSSGIIVLYNGKIGLIGVDGKCILSPEYLEIRDNIIDESNKEEKKDGKWVWNWEEKDGIAFRYSKDHPFQTSKIIQTIVRADYFVSTYSMIGEVSPYIANCKLKASDFSTFITRDHLGGENIFDIERGFLLAKNVDVVIPITTEEFIIQLGDKYKLFSVNTADYVLPLSFDEVKYYGDGILYYRIDGLWGVYLFSYKLYHRIFFRMEKVIDIKPSFLSISPVYSFMDMFIYFGVECRYKTYSGEEGVCSKLLNTRGECIIGNNNQYIGSFQIHDSIVLCQIDDKYGFVNRDDELVIPFKFDQILFRGKGNYGGFDVRIGDFWGILKHDGRESHIKYDEPVTFRSKYEIVTDSLSGLKGVLNTETCEEVVPCLYSHIILEENHAIVARGGRDEENCIVGCLYAKWGCYNLNGKLIVPVKYGYIKLEGEYVLAGYDGRFMTYGQNNFYKEFGGKYSLYNSNGELLIEGFSQYELGEFIWAFYFGGEWKTSSDECGFDDYSFNYDFGRWLLVTPKLTTIIPQENGKSYTIERGTKIYWTKESNGKKIINRINFPLRLLVENEYYIKNGWVIDKNGKEAINLSTGCRINDYNQVYPLSNNLLYVLDEYKAVGIIDNKNQIVITPQFYAVTYPVGKYFIGVKKTDSGCYEVCIYDLYAANVLESGVLLTTENTLESLKGSFRYHRFLMYQIGETGNSFHDYAFEKGKCWIDEPIRNDFRELMVNRVQNHNKVCYWFSGSEMEAYYGSSYGNDHDYMKDSWDAMTDGMYGDIPDGFAGDYGFIGR